MGADYSPVILASPELVPLLSKQLGSIAIASTIFVDLALF